MHRNVTSNTNHLPVAIAFEVLISLGLAAQKIRSSKFKAKPNCVLPPGSIICFDGISRNYGPPSPPRKPTSSSHRGALCSPSASDIDFQAHSWASHTPCLTHGTKVILLPDTNYWSWLNSKSDHSNNGITAHFQTRIKTAIYDYSS